MAFSDPASVSMSFGHRYVSRVMVRFCCRRNLQSPGPPQGAGGCTGGSLGPLITGIARQTKDPTP